MAALASGIREAFTETPASQGNICVLIIGLLSNIKPLGGDLNAELEAQYGHKGVTKNLVYRAKVEWRMEWI